MAAASRPRDAFKRPSGGCSRNFGLRVWCWERAEPCRVLSSRRSVASKDVIGACDGRDDALEILQRRVGVPVRSPVTQSSTMSVDPLHLHHLVVDCSQWTEKPIKSQCM
jgi:hypothetical protein